MNKLTHIGTIGLVSLLAACSTLPRYAGTGSVSEADGDDLRVCFESKSTPLSGQEVDIVRREAVGSLHPPVSYVDRKVGVARVEAAPAGSTCVAAKLMTGKAGRFDMVRWLPVGSEL